MSVFHLLFFSSYKYVIFFLILNQSSLVIVYTSSQNMFIEIMVNGCCNISLCFSLLVICFYHCLWRSQEQYVYPRRWGVRLLSIFNRVSPFN